MIVKKIESIIKNFVKDEYDSYLNNNNILLIDNDKLFNIITKIYNNNIKNIKNLIRNKLKQELKEEYPSATIENTLFDIFQDNENNIKILYNDIINYQEENYLELYKNIDNDSLGIKIGLENDKCIIIDIADKNNLDELKILDYYYLYSINDVILTSIHNKIENLVNIIKDSIKDREKVKIGLYYFKPLNK